jgi:hypothetical protein
VAHALRALGRRENALRLDELAVALGYWAATYQELPVAHDGASPSDARSAFTRIAVVPPAERRFTGTITGALAALSEHPPFAPVIGWLDVSPPIAAGIGALTATFARACLANVHDPLTAIVFVHGVTCSAALRALAPQLDDATARSVLRYAWQAGAGLHAAFGQPAPAGDEAARPTVACADLVERAIAHGDEHAIKMVEAAIAETRTGGDGIHLAAAERVLAHLAP